MSNLSYVGIFFILCVLGILYSLWASARKQRALLQLRQAGILVQAEVADLQFVQAEWKDGVLKREAYYSLTYRFNVDAPAEQTIPYLSTISVSRQVGDDLEIGLPVPVLYLPGSPQVSMLEAEVQDATPTSVADYAKIVVFAAVVVLIILMMMRISDAH
jgi:hypothetical protein